VSQGWSDWSGAQIAAIARARGFTRVNRNVKDFAFAGRQVFNPWSARQPRHGRFAFTQVENRPSMNLMDGRLEERP